jgi:hypothetical protein
MNRIGYAGGMIETRFSSPRNNAGHGWIAMIPPAAARGHKVTVSSLDTVNCVNFVTLRAQAGGNAAISESENRASIKIEKSLERDHDPLGVVGRPGRRS